MIHRLVTVRIAPLVIYMALPDGLVEGCVKLVSCQATSRENKPVQLGLLDL